MVTFGKVCKGMGGAAFNVHKDIYKVSAVLRNDMLCLPGFPLRRSFALCVPLVRLSLLGRKFKLWMRSSPSGLERLTAMPKSQQSWVHSQHPPTNWTAGEAMLNYLPYMKIQAKMVRKKEKIPVLFYTLV
jgi:hypothetical protein